MSLDDVATFVQVVDSAGFTAAGRVLGRSTKQISRQVQRLEGHLDMRLLRRTTRAVRPSDAGLRFYAHAVQILEQVAQTCESMYPQDGVLSGRLRVALPTLTATAGLAGWLRVFRQRHPDVSLQVTLTDRPRDLVAEGLDLQISAVRPSQTTLMIRRLLVISAPLAAHQSYLDVHPAPTHPDELQQHECLLFISDLPQTTWSLIGPAGSSRSVPVSGSLQSSSSEVLFSALREGLGIGMCGQGYLSGAGREQGLVPVLPGWTHEPMPLYAVFSRSERSSRRIEALLDIVVQGLKAWL